MTAYSLCRTENCRTESYAVSSVCVRGCLCVTEREREIMNSRMLVCKCLCACLCACAFMPTVYACHATNEFLTALSDTVKWDFLISPGLTAAVVFNDSLHLPKLSFSKGWWCTTSQAVCRLEFFSKFSNIASCYLTHYSSLTGYLTNC